MSWRDAAENVLRARRAGGGPFEPRVAYGDDGSVVCYVASGCDGELCFEGGGRGISVEAALTLEGTAVERLARCAGVAVEAALRGYGDGAAIALAVDLDNAVAAACALVLARRMRADLRISMVVRGATRSGLRRCAQNLGVEIVAAGAPCVAEGDAWLAALALTRAEIATLALHFARSGGLIPETLARSAEDL